jgi:hypothetical protein
MRPGPKAKQRVAFKTMSSLEGAVGKMLTRKGGASRRPDVEAVLTPPCIFH